MKAGMAVRLGVGIAGVLMAGSVLALAQGSGGMGPGMGSRPGFGEHRPPFERAMGPKGELGRWWNTPAIVEKLKLTDDQRKAMDQTLFQHREKLIDLRAGVQKAELEMQPLIQEDQPNEAKILAQIDKVAQARAELEKANARFLLAIRGKLTPEQWKQVQAFRANRGQGRGNWGQGGEGRGGQGRDGWKPGGQGPGGMGPGGQFRKRMPPPPSPPAAGQGAGPQSQVDQGAGPDGLGASAAGGQQ